MNTFLLCGDHRLTATVLDSRRLNKQLVEGIQVCKIILHHRGLLDGAYGFLSHPVWKLWKSACGRWLLPELVVYLNALSEEWHTRPGVRKRHRWEFHAREFRAADKRKPRSLKWPGQVYKTMRGNLIRKDPTHYRSYFRMFGLPIEEPMNGYFWEHPTIG